jgi:predicted enzyme related to lactoylglutathione lyase
MLRLAMGKEVPHAKGTVLGWQVPDIESAVRTMQARGVQFERWEFLKQDASGIWTSPTGARVAWFKDPDGNILSLSEHPEAKAV